MCREQFGDHEYWCCKGLITRDSFQRQKYQICAFLSSSSLFLRIAALMTRQGPFYPNNVRIKTCNHACEPNASPFDLRFQCLHCTFEMTMYFLKRINDKPFGELLNQIWNKQPGIALVNLKMHDKFSRPSDNINLSTNHWINASIKQTTKLRPRTNLLNPANDIIK